MAPKKTQNQTSQQSDTAAHSFRFRVPAGDETVLAFMEAQGRTEKNEALSLLVHLFVAQHGVVRVKDLLYKSYLEMVNRNDAAAAAAPGSTAAAMTSALSAQEVRRDAAVAPQIPLRGQRAVPAALADGVALSGAPDDVDAVDAVDDDSEELEDEDRQEVEYEVPAPLQPQPQSRPQQSGQRRHQAPAQAPAEAPGDDMSDFFGRPR